MIENHSDAINIFWFRRDLRLDDNIALYHALNNGRKVLPVFIYDTNILSDLPKDDARVNFIAEKLKEIKSHLKKYNTSLAVFHGEPTEVFSNLVTSCRIDSVFFNRDYEPYAVKRDAAIGKLLSLHGIAVRDFKDHVIFEKSEIVKPDGQPYVVFTPYSKKWKEKLETELSIYQSESLPGNFAAHSFPFKSHIDIGFSASPIQFPELQFTKAIIENYDSARNFPAFDQTSKLGVHLRFGTVSIRKIVDMALKHESFLNELIWREFFMQILWHFPNTVRSSFRPKYDEVKWRNNEEEFRLWCEGNTGYPIVDAGMRELNATGFMHNRVRMIVASFLCKHLLIDWRWGETYFALKLLDYEQASNVGNWQWAAGSGVDAAPYFRIFNPAEQVRKFDKDLKYVRKWVPEIDTLNYPPPMVEHKFARERCLTAYKLALYGAMD